MIPILETSKKQSKKSEDDRSVGSLTLNDSRHYSATETHSPSNES